VKPPTFCPTAYGSKTMSRVRGKDTHPELVVRSLVHRLGYRFRLHRTDLPGKPDLVFPGRNCVIFVHGCLWHGHSCKNGVRRPKSNTEFWTTKIEDNRARDARTNRKLRRLGWRVLTIWACRLDRTAALIGRILRFLNQR